VGAVLESSEQEGTGWSHAGADAFE